MDKIATILVPFDFSNSAKLALDYTVKFVGDSEIKIHLVYISDKPDIEMMRKAYESLCEKYESKLKLPLRWILGYGDFTDTIIEAQEEKKIDLIIMGTSGLLKKGEETHTSKLVAEAKCPVLVIPEDTEKKSINNISLVLGENEIDNPKLLGTLLEISRKFNAKVHVLTVQNTKKVYGYSESDEKNEHTIMYYLENFYNEHTFIENPDIVEGIFSYVNNHNIDMIAILPRNHADYNNPSEGLLTKELVMRTKVPVLAIE